MEIKYSNERIEVTIDYRPLNEKLDKEIIKLFEKYFKNPFQSVKELFEVFPTQFDNELMNYFDRVTQLDLQDNAFNAITPIFNSYIDFGLLDEAQKLWERILIPVQKWQELRKKRIHKGSIFYFWARPVILKGNYDLGFFLIHQAYEEDKETQSNERPHTPAYFTAIIDYKKNQYLLPFVNELKIFIDEIISQYNLQYHKQFSFDIFFQKFLSTFSPIDVVFYFTHCLAKLVGLKNTPKYCLESVFSGLYELDLFYTLCLVIDTLIHNINPTQAYFANHANFLIRTSQINVDEKINYEHLTEINNRKDINPSIVIDELLDRKFVFTKDRYIPSSIECDIYISYCLRNHSAHKLDSIPTVWKRKNEIQQSIFNVLFFAIETLY